MTQRRFLPYGRQLLDEADIEAVVGVLRGDWLTCGPSVDAFERGLADYLGAKHVVAVSNGTAALHLAMLAAKVGPGDRVLTTPMTFLASANCAQFVGAEVDFCDIRPKDRTICPEAIEAAWTDNTRAVVAVDYAGYPCQHERIATIARTRGAYVIDDACHGVGTQVTDGAKRWKIGGHPWADMTVFSFHPVKTMTAGEGGAIATDDDELAARCRQLRTHGMTKDTGKLAWDSDDLTRRHEAGEPVGPWYYEMPEVGYNYRITDIQCALGLSQLGKLDGFIDRRQAITDRYNEAFAGQDLLTLPPRVQDAEHTDRVSWHLYSVGVDFVGLGLSRAPFMARLREKGVGTQVLYVPVHLQPYYRKRYGYGPGKCPNAEAFYRTCLALPLYPAMSDEDVEHVIEMVLEEVSR